MTYGLKSKTFLCNVRSRVITLDVQDFYQQALRLTIHIVNGRETFLRAIQQHEMLRLANSCKENYALLMMSLLTYAPTPHLTPKRMLAKSY